MTLFDFQLLDEEDKLEWVYTQGVYIGKRKQGSLTVLLYQVESFYVEIFYNKHRCFLNKIHCFSSTTWLDPYLEQIIVEDLAI